LDINRFELRVTRSNAVANFVLVLLESAHEKVLFVDAGALKQCSILALNLYMVIFDLLVDLF